MARWFCAFLARRVSRLRKRFIQGRVRSTGRRRAFRPAFFSVVSSPRERMCATQPKASASQRTCSSSPPLSRQGCGAASGVARAGPRGGSRSSQRTFCSRFCSLRPRTSRWVRRCLHQERAFGARLAAVGGAGPGFFPPPAEPWSARHPSSAHSSRGRETRRTRPGPPARSAKRGRPPPEPASGRAPWNLGRCRWPGARSTGRPCWRGVWHGASCAASAQGFSTFHPVTKIVIRIGS